MRIAIVGGALTGNKGSASMVLGVIDGLPEARPAVLSLLAEADEASELSERATVVDYGPVQIVLACLLAPLAALTGGRVGTRALRALAEADVVADVSGISFVAGRGLPTLAYNVLLLLPALVMGTSVVKVSQAMGPFDDPLTRTAARLVLPRVAAVLARGERTVEHLDELGVEHAGLVTDAAFLMATTPQDAAWAEEWLAAHASGPDPVVVVPSQVVVNQTTDDGAAYLASVTALVDHLTETHDVIVMAHSARPGRPAGRLNDIPLCETVVQRAARPERCRLVTDGTPGQLRALMAASRLVVTSRFHAMISALATATPVVVIGWSHKYREVLREFGHEELAFDFTAVETSQLLADVDATLSRATDVAADFERALPGVRAAAERNTAALRDHARRSGPRG